MKTDTGNASGACTAGGDNWINGNILFDRDVFGNGDFGDYGVSLFGNGGRWPSASTGWGPGRRSAGPPTSPTGAWHHVAATRNATTGQIRLFVDGQPDGAAGSGPTGDVSYRDGRSTSFPDSDPVPGDRRGEARCRLDSSRRTTAGSTRCGSRTSCATRARSRGRPRRSSATPTPWRSTTSTKATGTRSPTRRRRGGPSDGVREVGGASQSAAVVDRRAVRDVDPVDHAADADHRRSARRPRSPTPAMAASSSPSRRGTIRIWDGTQLLATPFLTVAPIFGGGEEGLLSVAFHPQYTQNGFFYVYYTDAAGNVVIARYTRLGQSRTSPIRPAPGTCSPFRTRPAITTAANCSSGPTGTSTPASATAAAAATTPDRAATHSATTCCSASCCVSTSNQNVNAPPYYGIPPTQPLRRRRRSARRDLGEGPAQPVAVLLRSPDRRPVHRRRRSSRPRRRSTTGPADSPGGENYGWKRMEGFYCDTCGVADCPVAPPPCNHPVPDAPDPGLSITRWAARSPVATSTAASRSRTCMGSISTAICAPARIWWARRTTGSGRRPRSGPPPAASIRSDRTSTASCTWAVATDRSRRSDQGRNNSR